MQPADDSGVPEQPLYAALLPLELAVVVPTFNERDNITLLINKLSAALQGIRYEVIFVDDDSPDGTAEWIRSIAQTNPRIRVIQRIQRRGLASACIEGMMSTAAPHIAVMDADLQHDESILPRMLRKLQSESLDVVVATRNAEGGSMGSFARHRVLLSNLGHRLSRAISKAGISDPMSGFFVVTRGFLHEVARFASGIGFKILLDLVASAERPVRVGEVAYAFRERAHGASKLDTLVSLEYLQLLVDKTVGGVIPSRFVIFSVVGAVGVGLAFTVLYLCVSVFGLPFFASQAIATFAAMTENFFLNNSMTYRDRRLRGRRMWTGLLTFYVASSIGAIINVRIAELGRSLGAPWYTAGICGLAVGAVWNFGVTSFTTWRQDKTSAAVSSRRHATRVREMALTQDAASGRAGANL
jgi:dolichol-phosphate mannosyltransferase